MSRLPDIIEWVLPLQCNFCNELAVHVYRSKDGEELYTCRTHGRSNAIKVTLPEGFPEQVYGCIEDIKEIKWFERLYYLVTVFKQPTHFSKYMVRLHE